MSYRASAIPQPVDALAVNGLCGTAFREPSPSTPNLGRPSSENLRLIRRFEKGGAGSSGVEFEPLAIDGASGSLRYCFA